MAPTVGTVSRVCILRTGEWMRSFKFSTSSSWLTGEHILSITCSNTRQSGSESTQQNQLDLVSTWIWDMREEPRVLPEVWFQQLVNVPFTMTRNKVGVGEVINIYRKFMNNLWVHLELSEFSVQGVSRWKYPEGDYFSVL